VAEDVGYESEAAFNRAFKREFGVPPATWRRSAAGSATREGGASAFAGTPGTPASKVGR